MFLGKNIKKYLWRFLIWRIVFFVFLILLVLFFIVLFDSKVSIVYLDFNFIKYINWLIKVKGKMMKEFWFDVYYYLFYYFFFFNLLVLFL